MTFKIFFLGIIILFSTNIYARVILITNNIDTRVVYDIMTKNINISYSVVFTNLLSEIVKKLEQGQNIIFTKFGDGEYNCMIGQNGHNCDNDTYHSWLGQRLSDSLINLSKKPNAYIGRWWTEEVYRYCDQLALQKNVVIPWVWYHLFLNNDNNIKFDYMHEFVNFVIHTKRKKILICNNLNKRLKDFFRADVYIAIPAQNWSFEYDKWKKLLECHLEKDAIVLIAGGMCSKVLIADITDHYNLTCIDLGSSFDLLAQKQKSRACLYTYEDVFNYYKDLLPLNWE